MWFAYRKRDLVWMMLRGLAKDPAVRVTVALGAAFAAGYFAGRR